MASNHASPPPSLPPKAPLVASTSASTSTTPRDPRVASLGSHVSSSSLASNHSREGLLLEVLRRRKSLTHSEYNFLQDVVANGTEVEIQLVHNRLTDPSLGIDADDMDDDDQEAYQLLLLQQQRYRQQQQQQQYQQQSDSFHRMLELNSGSYHSIYDLQQQQQHPPAPDLMHLQFLNPTHSMSLDHTDNGSFDVDASIDTCATGQGKPPPTPIPMSPYRDQTTLVIPSHEELYPDIALSARWNPSSINDLEQTPLVQNLRQPKSLEGAAYLPISGFDQHLFRQDILETPCTNNTSSRAAEGKPVIVRRQSSNPLVDQLWRAHEQGLVVTPLQSTKRIQRRREHQSLTAASSPLRRLSSAGFGTSRYSYRGSLGYTSSSPVDPHSKSLLSPQELRKIRQRHYHSRMSTGGLLPFGTQQHHHDHDQQQPLSWTNQITMDARMMMMVLQNTSTDSSNTMDTPDISSLMLPTDEEIFRRSLVAKQQSGTTTQPPGMERPPPPRPFAAATRDESLVTKSTGGVLATCGMPLPPNAMRRMVSDGNVMANRRPSALRRMTSDASQRSKSVSWQIQGEPKKNAEEQMETTEMKLPENLKEIAPLTESNDMDDSVSTFASEHPIQEVLRAPMTQRTSETSELTASANWGRRDSQSSIASMNLHKAKPIRHESIGSTTDGLEAARSFKESLATSSAVVKEAPFWERKESIAGSIAGSLNLLHAHPIRREESILGGATLEAMELCKLYLRALAAFPTSTPKASEAAPSTTWGRRDSSASLNLHLARPIRQDSIASTAGTNNDALEAFQKQFYSASGIGWGRRDSVGSLASLNLHMAAPIRESIFKSQDSLDSASLAGEEDTDQAFRPNGWTRRESMNSIASLNLHHARPIRQDSIASTGGLEGLNRRDSTNSLASLALHRAHPIHRDSMASTVAEGSDVISAFRAQVARETWGRRDSMQSVASLNLHRAHPLHRESIASDAEGWEAAESLHDQFRVQPGTTVKPSWSRHESLGSVASLNLHHAHPIASDYGEVPIDLLRNIGSAFPDADFESSARSFPSRPSLGQDSIVSTASGRKAKEALEQSINECYKETLREAPSGTALSSLSDIASLHRNSLTSIPSLHPARPIRQDSIASTAAGQVAKDLLLKQVSQASIVASQWEGVVSADSWEDKKMEDEDVVIRPRNVARPVIVRHASQNEYDEEGMEVAPVEDDTDHDTVSMKLKTQILVPKYPAPEPLSVSYSSVVDQSHTRMEDTAGREVSPDGRRRQDGYRNFTSSLASFGTESRKSIVTIEASASFDETKSIDRYRGVFRGILPRSLSDDELSALLMAHCKPKLGRGQSEATVFPADLNSDSWELDTIVGEYDAWDAIRDDYINGYGGGDTLPFRILGTSARDVDATPHVLSPPLMESLQSFFPITKSQDNFWLKYSLVRDGASLHTLMQHARGAKYSVLAVETSDGEVFGAFTAEPWRKTWNYFGTGESFLWRMRNSRKTKCYSILDQAQMESEIDVYPYTGANQCIQLCTHNKIAVGGGSPEYPLHEEKRDDNDNHLNGTNEDKTDEIQEHEFGYGLELFQDLLHGTSSPCVTFGSPSLSKTHKDGSIFEILNVELWGLTPCTSETEAEKLELGRLFLEQSSFNNGTFE